MYVICMYRACNKVKVKSSLAMEEPPSGKSTTTECGVNYQLLTVIY